MTLEQCQRLFEELRSETTWEVDGELLWGYYFSSASSEGLSALGDRMEESGYRVVGIFEDDESETGGFTLRVEEEETHTPESLLARNQEFEALAESREGVLFQGLDVNSVTFEDDDEGDEDDEDDDEDDDGDEDDFFDDEEDDGPVENPELVAAIEQLTAEETPEAQDAVTNALLDAVFLIPTVPEGDGEPAPGGDDDEMIQLMVCVDEEEREFLPLFTDVEALRAWKNETVTVMELPAFEAWDFILAQASCSGAVINPDTQSLAVSREQVEYLQSVTDLDEFDDDEEDGEGDDRK